MAFISLKNHYGTHKFETSQIFLLTEILKNEANFSGFVIQCLGVTLADCYWIGWGRALLL